METYSNPILKGFYPDPSIVRVNNDYYMVNSTFQYFPAIPIHHSTDLVNWEQIGYGISESEYLDLSNISDSHGIWASDISYYNGEFYIFATMRLNNPDPGTKAPLRKILVTKSKNPEGPYSKPIVLDIDSIDPSHFVDDDGTHYCITAPGITITKLNSDCSEIIEPPKNVWKGTGLRCAEGPHILKKDGYYYAILAEGGTGYGHQISVGRSKNLYGPYESSPYNPALTQKYENARLQRCGHGDLVQTQNGDWWAVYLCGRPNCGSFTTVGRETSLDSVTWTDDNWFIVNGPSDTAACPDLPKSSYTKIYKDDFDSERLNFIWEFVRNPHYDKLSLTERKGFLTIEGGEFDLSDIRSYNTILRREESHSYTAVTRLEFEPKSESAQSGITCYYGINNYIKCFITLRNSLPTVILEENRNGIITEINSLNLENYNNSAYIKVNVNKQERSFEISLNETEYIEVGTVKSCEFLSDEGVTIGKHHTGTLVGMFSICLDNSISSKAYFDFFDYSNTNK